MNVRFYSTMIAIGALLAPIQAFCDEDLETRVDELESDMSRIRSETAFGTYGARTASAAPQIDGFDFFVTADFLWWKLYEGGTEYALKNENGLDVSDVKGPIKHLNFDWEPGYKVGLGSQCDFDGWDLYLEFTSFKTHAHKSVSSNNQGLFPLMGTPSSEVEILLLLDPEEAFGFSQATAHWRVDFYDLDFVLGRNYFISKYLAMHPYAGLTSAWIQQHRHAHFNNQPLDALKLKGKNNFWGIGPRVGLDSQYYLCQHLSFYGDIAGALLWGKFHVSEKENDQVTQFQLYDLHSNLHRMVAMAAFSLGIAFETNFCNNTAHFMIKAGYEGQYWWRQNQFPIFNPSAPDFTRQSEDLSLQGLTVDFRLDF